MTDPVALPLTVDAALALSGDARRVLLGAWVLVGRPVVEDEQGWSFRTGALDSAVVTTPAGARMLLHRDDVILPLKKQPHTMFPAVVLIGRSSSNDVVVPHTSVSKLHARFEPGPPAALSDAASSNGTTLGGRMLPPNLAMPVTSSLHLAFGRCPFQILTVDDLEHVLRQRIP